MVMSPNNAINADSQKRRIAPLLLAGYGKRWAANTGHINPMGRKVRVLKFSSTIGSLLLLFALVAHAGDINPILGKWEENRPNGSKMVWEFTATTIAFTPIDASGKQAKPPNKADISYKKLGRSELGEGYGIEFKSENGKPGGGIMAFVKDSNTMLLDFPGVGAHKLIRVQP